MKKCNFYQLIKVSVVLFAVTLLHSCTPEGSSPVRNKYPESLSSEEGGGFESFQAEDAISLAPQATGFATSTVNYQFASGLKSSLAVSLPDILNDSLAEKLIQTYRPLAIPLLTQWARHNSQGVVLDLRASISRGVIRSEFMIEQRSSFSFPLVFIYDHNSAQRANEYINMLKEFPEIQCRKISVN